MYEPLSDNGSLMKGVPKWVASSGLARAFAMANSPMKRLPAAMGFFMAAPKVPVERVVRATQLPFLPEVY